MRFLADENIPRDAVEALRTGGHDVRWVSDSQPGITDEDVVALATQDERTPLTFDKEFGELAAMRGMTVPAGIVLFRVRASGPSDVARLAVDAIGDRSDWAGRLSVVEIDRIRTSPLPGVREDQ